MAAQFCEKNAIKIANKANELIETWAQKGHSPAQILGGLWNWRSIRGEYKDGHYSITLGLKSYNGWEYTWTH